MFCLENLPDVAADAAFALIEQYKADSSPHKVDLSPGKALDVTICATGTV